MDERRVDAVRRDDLIAALRLRYDHVSAETMFAVPLAKAGLPEKDSYDARELAAWRDALARVGDRLGPVLERIDALLSRGAAAAPEPPAKVVKAEVAKAEVAKAEVAKAEVAKVEVAKAEVAKVEVAKAEVAKVEAAVAPPPPAKAAPKPETVIEVVGLELGAGERVYVCGSFVDWELDRAIELKRAGEVHRATVPHAPDPSIAFKLLRRSADGAAVWEGGDDRKLDAAHVEVTWRAGDARSD